METNATISQDVFNLGITALMILLNGYFVAAEFALVKMNQSKISTMVKEQRPFAGVAKWLFERQNLALSACQLGITMASLALGWIGEPAVAHLITPLILKLGITSQSLIHGISFAIAFSVITTMHIIIGEQVPKIYAIRKPAPVFLWSSGVLKVFYVVLFPFMYIMNVATVWILKLLGIRDADEHDEPLSEEEIRASLSLSHASGELTRNEHKLLNAVFKFDDEVARHIMLPRGEVQFIDINNEITSNFEIIKESKHTRFPICDGSLDKVIGILHIKDLIGKNDASIINLTDLARKPMYIPENIPIGHLLQEFKVTKQHFALVQNEHGTTLGIVTMEDVLEELVGSMEDEFDDDDLGIIAEGTNECIVKGEISIAEVNDKFAVQIISKDAETLSGAIVECLGHRLQIGDKIELDDNISAEVLEVEGIRATKVKLIIQE